MLKYFENRTRRFTITRIVFVTFENAIKCAISRTMRARHVVRKKIGDIDAKKFMASVCDNAYRTQRQKIKIIEF